MEPHAEGGRAPPDQKWIVLYVERWLKAPMQRSDGTLVPRVKGTPQGSPISPCLANLFLHYGLDAWMVREFPAIPFERFADDAVIHCVSESQARLVRDAVACRLVAVGLELHPDKTRIVYCKDSNRRGDYEEISLGRAGARCRRYRRSVSPTRPPNRTCPFLSIRLSTGLAMADRDAGLGNGGLRRGGGPSCSGGRRPRRGDPVAAIAISGDRHLGGPREPRAFTAGPVVPPAPSPDLFPGQPRVLLA